MIALVLCVLSFALTYQAGKRSLGLGLILLFTWGYFFGIIRANLLTTSTYFIFDAAVVGLYLSQKRLFTGGGARLRGLRIWAVLMMAWPIVLVVMPFQPFLISMVGLRGAALFFPMILLGGRLQEKDIRQLSAGLALLNLIALGFAVAEYFLGLPRFYPYNAATVLIYSSVDVAGGFYRLPAIFATSHLYGGMMASSIPYLIGAWEHSQTVKARLLSLAGIAAAFLGVLMSATRLNFVVSLALILVTILNGRMTSKRRVGIALLTVLVAAVALNNQRFQRFKSLSDTDYVEDRISGSVNRGFFEILLEYPMGNGLGGGGTSIPYFLQGQVRNPIGMENEYARILSEQGVIGLLLWMGFIAWFLSRFKVALAKGPWSSCRRLVWCLSIFGLVTGAIGTGMLTAIPETAIMLLGIGWTSTSMLGETREKRLAGIKPAGWQPSPYRPVPTLESR
jgi:hypothetical protein